LHDPHVAARPDVRVFVGRINAEQLERMSASADPRARELASALADVLTDSLTDEERAWVTRIEAMRERLNARTDRIRLIDYGSGPHQGRTVEEAYEGIVSEAIVGEVAAKRSKIFPWTLVLFEIVRHAGAKNALELGAAYGVSAAYQAAAIAARGGGRFTTIEGDPEQAKIAASNLAGLGLEVSVVAGRFQDVLADVLAELAPVDYVFLDGHHERNATIAYFEQILPALEEGAIVVFDDISWSEGMRDAWSVVSGHPRVAVAVDLVEVGVCVVRTEPRGRESYRLLMAPALDVPPADADG
jgi:predicted O-methyltransferase YrrM